MIDLLNDILDGADIDHMRFRAACILREIQSHRHASRASAQFA
jgi:hypothetical protein